MMDREGIVGGYNKAEILADPRKRISFTSYIYQAGQPAWVREQFAAAIGLEATEYPGYSALRTIPSVSA